MLGPNLRVHRCSVASGSSEKNESQKDEGDVISCVAIFYEKGASGNNYVGKEKFHAVLPKAEKTVKKIRETVR